ncbi:MAG: hypothetical protein E6J26_09175 [Chloroflexi bacterium]|nr:MAG: hypothetical protein E6J26_09175 [Chloroflexota bacterium]
MTYRSFLQPRLEAAEHINSLLQTKRERIVASDRDGAAVVDRSLEPYRQLYDNAGSKYGGTDAGMLKWYYERAHQYGFSPLGHDRYTSLKRRAAL